MLKQEHVNEIEETTDTSCKYRTWLTFAGMTSKSLRKKYGEAYQQKMQDFVRDLKERSVKLYKEDEKGGTAGKASVDGQRMQPITEVHSTTA